MDQLIPSLATLVEVFSDCFHPQVFSTFQALIAGWIVCLGPHTISGVWQATGLAAKRHHDTAYAVFHSACWEWDDLGIILATLILTQLVPGGVVWVAVDDTLCHKRGAKVAFGGIFLDAVLSSKKHKTFRFGLNWIVLGIAVPIPCAPTATSACRSSGGSTARRASRDTGLGPSRPPSWRGSWPRSTPGGPSGWSATAPTSTRPCCRAGPRTSRSSGRCTGRRRCSSDQPRDSPSRREPRARRGIDSPTPKR